VAGDVTVGPGRGSAGAGVRETARALIGMRRSLVRNAPGGQGMVATGLVVGWSLAVGTLLLGLVRFDDPERAVDLQAALALGWLVGWVMGPIAFRGGGQGLRPEYFALLPIPPRRLAAGLLGASFAGRAPAITLVALSSLLVAAGRLGGPAVLVAVPAVLLELVVLVLVSKVAVAGLTATLNSRRGQDLGGVLMAVIIALSSGGWSLAIVMAQQLAEGPPPALRAALRLLPSGWGPVAVGAAGRSDWPLAAAALAALAALAGLLLVAWAGLLQRNMRRTGGRAARVARGRPTRAGAATGRSPAARRRAWSAGATGAVVGKELRAWRRDPSRNLALLLGLLISVLNIGVPAVAFDAPAGLPWVGVAAALLASVAAVNVYGNDGTAFWLTRMVPGSERADVRGRQAAWLLAVAPAMVVLTVGLTAFSGQTWAWPWVLAALPALLGGTAGLMVLVSVARPVQQKDPQLRTGPFDTSDDPSAAGAVMGQTYLMLLLAALTAVPGCALVLLGAVWHRPALQGAGVLVGVGVGVGLTWWGGRVAARRLADRGAELMDLLRLGPEAGKLGGGPADGRPEVDLPRRTSAAVGALWIVGMLCIFPQGLVPLAFALFGVDQQVRVWFVARYLPVAIQVPVAVGFVVLGALAVWWAESIRRRAAGRPDRARPAGP
jgi:ABC-2 type transport system permease protein